MYVIEIHTFYIGMHIPEGTSLRYIAPPLRDYVNTSIHFVVNNMYEKVCGTGVYVVTCVPVLFDYVNFKFPFFGVFNLLYWITYY